jgi:hypothetical protein
LLIMSSARSLPVGAPGGLGAGEAKLVPQVAYRTRTGREFGAAGQRRKLERHQQVPLQRSEPPGGGRQAGEIAGEAGHLRSPCPADRSEPAVAAKIGQPAPIGVGQDTKLDDGRDLPAYPGDAQIRPATGASP